MEAGGYGWLSDAWSVVLLVGVRGLAFSVKVVVGGSWRCADAETECPLPCKGTLGRGIGKSWPGSLGRKEEKEGSSSSRRKEKFVAELVKEKVKGEKRRAGWGELLRAPVRGAWSMRWKGNHDAILEDDGRSTAAVHLSGCPASLSRRPSGVPPPEGSFSDRAQELFMRDVFGNVGRGRSEAGWDVHGKCYDLFEHRVDLVCDD
ncbi:hypothetical protein FGB62_20g21 [Gracilaria domingensis]|nr:hypothetical protein FGB62_20g21 [Gracilaria domingensis]